MKKVGILFLLILTLWSCEEEIPEVSFRIKTEGFVLQESSMDNTEEFPSIQHRISGGIVTFSNDRHTYDFHTVGQGVEEYLFQLPIGEYQLTFTIPPASLYGQKGASFVAEPGLVHLDEQTDTLVVQVEANCSMFQVFDDLGQLEQGVFMIERHAFSNGYFTSYPLFADSLSGAYYTYFTPDTDTSALSAFLWFYQGKQGIEEGGLSTKDFKIGYRYNIRILE